MSEALATTMGDTTPVAWIAPAKMTYEQWAGIGSTFQQIESSLPWWLGDWLLAGEVRYGETYTQAIELTDSKIESLKQYKWVAGRIPPERRFPSLSWTHHRHVAKMDEARQGEWLSLAEADGWSSAELKARIADENAPPISIIPSRLTRDATPEEAAQWIAATQPYSWLCSLVDLLLEVEPQ